MHTALGFIKHFYTSIQMFKQSLSYPCSAVNAVPGEYGHRARNWTTETTRVALGQLSLYSVHKASWCSKRNSWTTGWDWMSWKKKMFDRCVYGVYFLLICCHAISTMNKRRSGMQSMHSMCHSSMWSFRWTPIRMPVSVPTVHPYPYLLNAHMHSCWLTIPVRHCK